MIKESMKKEIRVSHKGSKIMRDGTVGALLGSAVKRMQDVSVFTKIILRVI